MESNELHETKFSRLRVSLPTRQSDASGNPVSQVASAFGQTLAQLAAAQGDRMSLLKGQGGWGRGSNASDGVTPPNTGSVSPKPKPPPRVNANIDLSEARAHDMPETAASARKARGASADDPVRRDEVVDATQKTTSNRQRTAASSPSEPRPENDKGVETVPVSEGAVESGDGAMAGKTVGAAAEANARASVEGMTIAKVMPGIDIDEVLIGGSQINEAPSERMVDESFIVDLGGVDKKEVDLVSDGDFGAVLDEGVTSDDMLKEENMSLPDQAVLTEEFTEPTNIFSTSIPNTNEPAVEGVGGEGQGAEEEQPLALSGNKKMERLQASQESEGGGRSVRIAGEALSQQGDASPSYRDGAPRGREQVSAQALTQSMSPNASASGIEKPVGVVGSGGLQSSAVALKAPAGSAPVVTRLNTPFQQPSWAEMMQGRVNWMVQSNIKMATVYIDPPELGPVHITIQQNGDQAQVNFQVQNQSVRDLLEQNVHRLRESLSEQGFSQVDVNVRGGDQGGQGSSGREDNNSLSGRPESVGAGEDRADEMSEPPAQNTVHGLINTYA